MFPVIRNASIVCLALITISQKTISSSSINSSSVCSLSRNIEFVFKLAIRLSTSTLSNPNLFLFKTSSYSSIISLFNNGTIVFDITRSNQEIKSVALYLKKCVLTPLFVTQIQLEKEHLRANTLDTLNLQCYNNKNSPQPLATEKRGGFSYVK